MPQSSMPFFSVRALRESSSMPPTSMCSSTPPCLRQT
jgi:hypothetical protein